MKRPLFIVGFTYFLSLIIASTFGISVSMVLGIICLAMSIIIALTNAIKGRQLFLCVLLCATVAFFSYSAYTYMNVQPVRELDNQDAFITATLVDLPTQSDGKYYYTLETDSIYIQDAPQDIKVKVSTSNPLNIDPYEHISGKVHFYLSSDAGDSFTSRNYYDSKGIYIKAFLYEYEDYSITSRTEKPIYYYALQARQSIMTSINYILPQKESSLVNAAMLGQKQYLSDDVINNFRIDGVSHILAVSGLHVSVIALAIMALLLFLKVPRKISALSSAGVVLVFMAITGFVPSVMRAGIMAIIMYLGIAFSKRADPINSLGIAVLALCLFNPLAAGDVGLILSFFATLGLLTLYPKIYSYTQTKIKVSNRLKNPVNRINQVFCSTLSAVLFTIPFTVVSFGQISLISPISNLLLVFPMSMMMIMGLIAALLNLLNLVFLAMPFALITKIIADYSLIVSSILAKIPFASINTNASFILLVVASIIILLAITIYIAKDKYLYRFSIILSILILLTSVLSYQILDSNNSEDITIINTGEGCAVYIDGYSGNMLISCGGGDKGTYQINDFLESNNIDNLDYLLIPDSSDNSCSAAGNIIEKYTPKTLFVNEDCKNKEQIARTLEGKDIDYFYKDIIISLPNEIQIETKTNDDESFIACNINNKSFLICSNGGNVKDIPEEWRNCNFFIVGDMPKNSELISCDYMIMSMYEDDMINSIQDGIPYTKSIMTTGKDGNININILNNSDIKISTK